MVQEEAVVVEMVHRSKARPSVANHATALEALTLWAHASNHILRRY